MARQGSFAALIALLAACSGATTKPAGGELQISVEVETRAAAATPREGELATLVFQVRNASKDCAILRDLTQPRDLMLSGSSGSVASWQFSQTGLLSYSPENDEWTYDRSRRADTPRPVFNSGLLVPGEALTVRAKVRLLEMPMDFQFSYFELPADELRRKVYFESKRDRVVHYRTMVGSDLQAQLIPSKRTEDAGHRFVVFPHAEPIGTTPLLKTIRLDQPLKPRPFGLDQAIKKAGTSKPAPGSYTYSILFESWVLPKPDGYVLVSPTAVTPLPEIVQVERTFYLLDTIGPGKVEIDLRGDAVAQTMQERKYTLVSSSAGPRKRYYLFLLPDELPRLFADVRALKLALDVEFGEGGGRLQVVHK